MKLGDEVDRRSDVWRIYIGYQQTQTTQFTTILRGKDILVSFKTAVAAKVDSQSSRIPRSIYQGCF